MLAAGEWLRSPSLALAGAALVLALLTALLLRRSWLLLPLGATALLLASGQWNLGRLQDDWSGPRGEREERIQRASGRLNAELTEARLLADSLARRALVIGGFPREAGFEAAARLGRSGPLEAGLVVFEPSGAPRIWAGRIRLPPSPSGDSVDVRLTPYYAVLEVRRHDATGRTALGAVLLAADPIVSDGGRSVAARFRQRTGVGLHLLLSEEAPDISDVFDYVLPTTAGPRVLFSAQFVPAEQSEAVTRSRRTSSNRVTWVLLLTLAVAIWVVPAGWGRFVLVLLPFGLALRAPLGAILGISEWFDPAVFTSSALGPVSSAAGPLALSGIALILAARYLRERRLPRGLGAPLAFLILVSTPFLLAGLGRGIVPPAGGVSVRLWLIWQLSLFLFAAGLVTVALGAIRGGSPARSTGAPLVAAVLAAGTALVGLFIWQPLSGWPAWYLGLWLLGFLPLLWPADWRAEIGAVAIVAGSAASVLAWSADSEGKVRAARSDMAGLSETPDPAIESSLQVLGRALLHADPPRSVPDLYALWRASLLHSGGRPVSLAAWEPNGSQVLELRLDELDLPRELLAAEVRALRRQDSLIVRSLAREPAMHYLLLIRRDSATVLTVALGPASGLVPPSRMGRLLGVRAAGRPLYRLAISPAPSEQPPEPGAARWRREGRLVLGQRTVTVAGIPRDVHGTVEVGTSGSLVVRGALVLLLDFAVLAGLGILAGILGGQAIRRPAWIPRLRSYEARIGIALAVFVLAPTLGFAAWGIGRLRGEVRASRDRNIEQTLRDVLPARAELPATEPALTAELHALSERMDADFVLHREGRSSGGTDGGLLEALGLVAPLMDPEAFHRIVIDGAAVTTAAGPSRAVDVRIGYRSLRLADLGSGVLAMPQAGFDPVLEDRQRDLAMLFLLVTVLGIGASLLAAHAAARVLSRPVAELQAAALAFGKGKEVVLPTESPVPEFAPVFGAFEKMTADIRKTHEAQERVARIVAWGEMASQVAHEIKNPLTPMRLGVQHLRRVHEDGHTPIGPVLESTTERILAEIDRLDRIARSFSRFGVPASERGPLETVKLPSVVRDVVELYRLGPEGTGIVIEEEHPEPAAARSDEVKEALVNLLENSRNARARTIRVRITGTTITVEDDGRGIPASLLPMIFEPRFSTSTSGSGLGLPIVKRLVESWGGRVTVDSEEGQGTVVRLELRPATAAGPGPAASEGVSSPEPVQ